MDTLPYLTLHSSQIDDICAAVETDNTPRSRVQASPEAKTFATQRARAAGLKVPESGGWTIKQLDAALDAAFPPDNNQSTRKRMEMKSTLHAGGLILEPPDPTQKRNTVVAAQYLKKAGVPIPEKPYSVEQFDELLASKDINVTHKLQIKQACLKGGLLADSERRAAFGQDKPVSAAKQICESLGLDMPAGGRKLTVVAVDSAMRERTWDAQRRVHAKSVLASAGIL